MIDEGRLLFTVAECRERVRRVREAIAGLGLGRRVTPIGGTPLLPAVF
jgi:hypothetical protein